MHRVDYHHIRLYARRLGKYFVNVCFGQYIKPVRTHAEPRGTQPELISRFLARNVKHAARFAEDPAYLQKQRGFADAGLARQQHDRAAHKTAAEHAVELAEPRDRAHTVARLHFVQLYGTAAAAAADGKGAPRLSRRRFCFFGGRQLFDRILDKGIPCAALRAFSEPFGAFAAAGRADVYRFYTFHRLAPFLFLTSLYTIFTGQSIGGVPFGSR